MKNQHIYTETLELQTLTRKIERLPPSVKLVYKVLEYRGPLTQKEITAESCLPSRTVRYALTRLKEEGMLEERLYFKDGRQCLYSIKIQTPEELFTYPCGL